MGIGHSYCSARNFPLKKHYGAETLGKNRGRGDRIMTPNEVDLTFWVPNYGAKFHQNRVRIATEGGWTDRKTDRCDRRG